MIKFNAILDASPENFWGGSIQKTDFKQVLKFFRILEDNELDEQEKTEKIIYTFFNSIPEDVADIWDDILSFISCGEDKQSETGKKIFDYNADHGRIFAAFWQTYGVDLRSISLHWFVFCELFQGLPDDTKLMQVIELRGKKPDKNDSSDYKRKLRKLQNAYRLDDGHSALEAALDRW